MASKRAKKKATGNSAKARKARARAKRNGAKVNSGERGTLMNVRFGEFLARLAADPATYGDYLKNRYGGGTPPGVDPADWAALTSGDPRQIYQRLMGPNNTPVAAPNPLVALADNAAGQPVLSAQPILIYLTPTTDQQVLQQTPPPGVAQTPAEHQFIFTHHASTPKGPRLVMAMSDKLVW